MDVSSFLLGNYQNMYKTNPTIRAGQEERLNDRRTCAVNNRKASRNDALMQRRQIANMSLDNPTLTSQKKKTKTEELTTMRYQQLLRWKEERQRKKLQEKQQSKPLFVVRAIEKSKFKSSFAPVDHAFTAPANIKQVVNITNPRVKKPIEASSRQLRSRNTATLTSTKLPSKGENNKVKRTGLELRAKSNKDVSGRNIRKVTITEKKPQTISKLTRKKMQIVTDLDLSQETPPKIYKRTPKSVKTFKYSNKNNNSFDGTSPDFTTGKKYNKTPKKLDNAVNYGEYSNDGNSHQVQFETPNYLLKQNSSSKKKTVKTSSLSTKKTRSGKNYDGSEESPFTPHMDNKLTDGAISYQNNNRGSSNLLTVNLWKIEKITSKTPQKPSNSSNEKKSVTKSTRKSIRKSQCDDNNSESAQKPTSDEIIEEPTVTYTTRKSVRKSTIGEIISKTPQNKNLQAQTPMKQNELINEKLAPQTPSNIKTIPTVYVSPFVTISRGKARDSQKLSLNKSELKDDISNPKSPQAAANYFTSLLNTKIEEIEAKCDEWTQHKTHDLPEGAEDMIDVTIGQSKLLISKKFQQFRKLIEQCRCPSSNEQPVTCLDLHGFWDMIYIQVENLNKRFSNLENMRQNNWEEIVNEPKAKVAQKKRKVRGGKKAQASSSLRDMIRAARNQKNAKLEADVLAVTEVKSTPCRRSLRLLSVNNLNVGSPSEEIVNDRHRIKAVDQGSAIKSISKKGRGSSRNITKSVLFESDLKENEFSHLLV